MLKEETRFQILTKNLPFKFLIVIGILVWVFRSAPDKITFTEPDWSCNYLNNTWECKVTFHLTNNSHKPLSGQVSLHSGISMKKNEKDSSEAMNETKTIGFDLNEYETKNISQTVYLQREPTFMKITLLE